MYAHYRNDGADMNNYSPISVMPVVAKVFERIICDQLYPKLSENNSISLPHSQWFSISLFYGHGFT